MQLIDGRPVHAATDLVGCLAWQHRLALEPAAPDLAGCPASHHGLGLERAQMLGTVATPVRNDTSIELAARRGLEHEPRSLEDPRADGRSIVEIEKDGSAVAPLGSGEVTPP